MARKIEQAKALKACLNARHTTTSAQLKTSMNALAADLRKAESGKRLQAEGHLEGVAQEVRLGLAAVYKAQRMTDMLLQRTRHSHQNRELETMQWAAFFSRLQLDFCNSWKCALLQTDSALYRQLEQMISQNLHAIEGAEEGYGLLRAWRIQHSGHDVRQQGRSGEGQTLQEATLSPTASNPEEFEAMIRLAATSSQATMSGPLRQFPPGTCKMANLEKNLPLASAVISWLRPFGPAVDARIFCCIEGSGAVEPLASYVECEMKSEGDELHLRKTSQGETWQLKLQAATISTLTRIVRSRPSDTLSELQRGVEVLDLDQQLPAKPRNELFVVQRSPQSSTSVKLIPLNEDEICELMTIYVARDENSAPNAMTILPDGTWDSVYCTVQERRDDDEPPTVVLLQIGESNESAFSAGKKPDGIPDIGWVTPCCWHGCLNSVDVRGLDQEVLCMDCRMLSTQCETKAEKAELKGAKTASCGVLDFISQASKYPHHTNEAKPMSVISAMEGTYSELESLRLFDRETPQVLSL